MIEVIPFRMKGISLAYVVYEFMPDTSLQRIPHQDEEGVLPDDVASYGTHLVRESYENFYRLHAEVEP